MERFWKLKTLYRLKKNIQCANTHNYTNQWYTWQNHMYTRLWLVTQRCVSVWDCFSIIRHGYLLLYYTGIFQNTFVSLFSI